jgi:putative flippase GtrA
MDTEIIPSAPTYESKLESLLVKYPIILQLSRFVAIGVINTALDFIVLNFLSKLLNITSGTELGALNIISFSLAVVQSYFWNKYWAFNTAHVSLSSNFRRLVLVGGVGFLSFFAVLISAKFSAPPFVYFVIFSGFIIAELGLWIGFRLMQSAPEVGHDSSKQFVIFVIVSLVGLLVNSVIVSVLSTHIPTYSFLEGDLAKNVAKVAATVISLVWNFVAYKLIVFRR